MRAVSYRIRTVSRSDKLTRLPQGVEVKVVPETLKSPVRAPECSVGLSEKDTRLRQRLLELRLGPHYLMYVANSSRTTNPVTEHVDRLCWSKGLVAFGSEGTTVYREMMLWGRVLDDLLFRDFVDFTRSKGVERAARYLFGMEVALEHVGSITQLDRANWVAVKILDLDPHGDADVFAWAGKLCSQTRRAASRQARLRRLTKKFGGVSQSVWQIAQREMEDQWNRDWIDVATPMKKVRRRATPRKQRRPGWRTAFATDPPTQRGRRFPSKKEVRRENWLLSLGSFFSELPFDPVKGPSSKQRANFASAKQYR